MDKTQIIIVAVSLALVAFRLYQKYVKKNKSITGTDTKTSSDSAFSPSSKEDDYEPYSKR